MAHSEFNVFLPLSLPPFFFPFFFLASFKVTHLSASQHIKSHLGFCG